VSAPSSEDGHPVGTLHGGVYRARSVGRSRTSVAPSIVTAQVPPSAGRRPAGRLPARRPVSRVLSRAERGDGHPSRAPVTRRLLRPTRERGDAPLVRLTPHGLSYLALHQVELARFTRRRPEPPPTRLCGAGPRLSADGCYPLPCVAVLGLSSSGESPRRAQPSGHLAGGMTLAPAPRRPGRHGAEPGVPKTVIRRGSGPPGEPPRPDHRAPGWRARRRRGWWRAAHASPSSGRTRPAAGVPPRGAA